MTTACWAWCVLRASGLLFLIRLSLSHTHTHTLSLTLSFAQSRARASRDETRHTRREVPLLLLHNPPLLQNTHHHLAVPASAHHMPPRASTPLESRPAPLTWRIVFSSVCGESALFFFAKYRP